MRGEGSVDCEVRLVGLQKLHSLGKCTIVLTNQRVDMSGTVISCDSEIKKC